MKAADYLFFLVGMLIAGGLTLMAVRDLGKQFTACDVYVKTERYAFCVDADHVIDLANAKTSLERTP